MRRPADPEEKHDEASERSHALEVDRIAAIYSVTCHKH
jgi:hypothetical protein